MSDKRMTHSFKSYVGGWDEEILNSSYEDSFTEQLTPKLLQGESIIAEAHHVLMFAQTSERKQGKSGVLYVTNFKLSFITADEKPREEVSFEDTLQLGENDVCLSNVDAIYLHGGDRKKKLIPEKNFNEKVKGLYVICKNMRVLSFNFKFSPVGHGKNLTNTLLHHAFPKRHHLLFAYDLREELIVMKSETNMFREAGDWGVELARTGCQGWRLSGANHDFQMSPKLSRLAGVFLFDSKGRFSKPLARWCTVAVTVGILLLHAVRVFQLLQRTTRFVTLLLANFLCLSAALPLPVHVYSLVKNRKLVENFIGKLRHRIPTKSTSEIVDCMLVALGIIMVASFFHFKSAHLTNGQIAQFVYKFGFDLMTIFCYFIVLQFRYLINSQMKKMNYHKNYLKYHSLRKFGVISPLLKANYALFDGAKVVNDLFKSQILTLCIQCIIWITNCVFFILKSFDGSLGFPEKSYTWFCSLFCHLIMKLVMLILLNGCCENFNKHAEAFNNVLFKMMMESDELCKNDKLRLYVTMRQTVNFTACGFFSLGYPLVTSVIAAVSTYLVILIQFTDIK